MVRLVTLVIFFVLINLILGCTPKDESKLYTKLLPEETGIDFVNYIDENSDLNVIDYPFMYNGGGVGIGDINNNGYPDVFLAGNMVSSKLYLNKGDFKFEDITESAGLKTDKWITGVSMVDINNNGYLDIYLSVVSPEDAPAGDRANLLFINNGDNTFTEKAKEYNLADTSHTTHAVFLDYNKNGLLDVFLLNHSPGSFSRDMSSGQHLPGMKKLSTGFDRLYKNKGDGTFIDVSKEAGIEQKLGYGLGVVVSDFNRNGWPDIYVSNDLSPNDVLYVNSKDGTFTNKTSEYLKHTSFAGMGVDAADFNNDGWPDILQVDMMPKDYKDRKLMSGGTSYERFNEMREQGFDNYYSKNSLQLNRGIDKNGDLIFSEIGRIDNIAYTDWSWGALFGDYNNSGYKDILITNGYPKAVNNYDYLVNIYESGMFGKEEAIARRQVEILDQLEGIEIENFLFKNSGDLRFQNISEEWGFTDKTYSYGVAHADLNNNGRLDVIINNINKPASIYKNMNIDGNGYGYLMIELKGDSLNTNGIGSEVTIYHGDKKQYIYHSPYKGYQSTVDNRIHFGLGEITQIDSLKVIWPDERYQVKSDIVINEFITLKHANSTLSGYNFNDIGEDDKLFTEISNDSGLDYLHSENQFIDYNLQPLLPYKLSKLGPKIAAGDITGNGFDDIFISGSAGEASKLYIQNKDGSFKLSEFQPWGLDADSEDLGALFFDANDNGLLDLYVTSGGFEFSPASLLLQDRLYINIGNGRFIKDELALPRMLSSTSNVVAGDFNNNGLMDLFVGGRVMPGNYPYPARSYILENKGGYFEDVTFEKAPELLEQGMITDAIWVDFENNGYLDLITVGVWQSIKFYENENSYLVDITDDLELPPLKGWWYSLEKVDVNNDGYPDIIAGNMGLNYTYKTSPEKRFGVFANDFSQNLSTDIIFTVNENGTFYPFYGKAKLGKAIPEINNRFRSFKSFSEASLNDIFNSNLINEALHHEVDTFASVIIKNNGNKRGFTVSELPIEAQFSAIKGIITHDLNNNGIEDIILAGNIYNTEPDTPRNDASNGLIIIVNEDGNLDSMSSFDSGFIAPYDVKDIKLIKTPFGKSVLVANNSDSLQVFRINM